MMLFGQKISKIWLIGIIITAVLISAAIVVATSTSPQNKYDTKESGTINPTPTPSPTSTPSPTPSPTPIPQYMVTITQTANGVIAPDTGLVNAGSTPTYTITPNTGYNIASITANSGSVTVATPTGQSYQFTAISGPATLTATFTQITYSVTFATHNGGTSTTSPTGTQTYTAGQIVAITANPASDRAFSGWVATGSITFDSSTSASTNAHINGAGTITAAFKVLSVSITIDGQAWTNGSAIAWGTLVPGQIISKPISFVNTGDITITSITIAPDATSPLPTGWTETIPTLATALTPGLTANGYLYLTPSADAVPGTYTWSNNIITSTT